MSIAGCLGGGAKFDARNQNGCHFDQQEWLACDRLRHCPPLPPAQPTNDCFEDLKPCAKIEKIITKSPTHKQRKTMQLKLGEWLNNRLQKRKNEGATNYLPTIANNRPACRVLTVPLLACVIHRRLDIALNLLLYFPMASENCFNDFRRYFFSHRIVPRNRETLYLFDRFRIPPSASHKNKHQIKSKKWNGIIKTLESCQILIRENIFVNIKCLIE